MIYRFMFAGYSDNVHSVKILEGHDCYVALSGSAGKVFMYVESRQETVEPEMLATGENLQLYLLSLSISGGVSGGWRSLRDHLSAWTADDLLSGRARRGRDRRYSRCAYDQEYTQSAVARADEYTFCG